MRLGLLSDVHANLQALEAVLARLVRERVDAYVCAGDLVGYGADPDACVARVAALPGVAVAGNHDLMVRGRLPSGRLPPLAAGSLAWTVAHLGRPARDVLDGLPPLARAPGGVVVTHAALGDPERYVVRAEEAQGQLRDLDGEVLVVGHTHEALAVGERSGELLRAREGTVRVPAGERVLLNPGSVGQSRDRHALARAAVVDLERREATFLAVPYDVAACQAALRRAGRPAWSCHLSPALPARIRRGLATRLRPAPPDRSGGAGRR